MRVIAATAALTVLSATTLLGLSAPAHAYDVHDPGLNCAPPVQTGAPLLVLFAGEAHAVGGHHADEIVSLTLRCEYLGDNAWHTATATAAAPVVVLQDSATLVFGTFVTICTSGEAVYGDGHSITVPESCRTAPVEVNPGASPGIESTVTCEHARGPLVTNAWIVEVTAVAGTRPDVALATDVWCTLRDDNGVEVTATGTSVGGVAVATFAKRTAIASLSTKCYGMTVHYVLTGSVSTEYCQEF